MRNSLLPNLLLPCPLTSCAAARGRGVPNLVCRKLDLEQALGSKGSMGQIAIKHREQLDVLENYGYSSSTGGPASPGSMRPV